MITRLFLAIMLLGGSLSVFADAPRDPDEYFFHQSFGNLEEELETAREDEKKAVFVFFEMDECRWCKKMKETILNQPDVQDWYRAHFLNLVINVEGDVDMIDFQGEELSEKRFAINSTAKNERDLARDEYKKPTPYFVFFDLQGQRLASLAGIVKNKQEFLQLGQYVIDGEYQNMSFSKYKRTHKSK